MKISVEVSKPHKTKIDLPYYPGIRLLGMYVPNCVNKLPFPHILVNNCCFLNDRYSDWIRWDQNVVLICISLIANEIEHVFHVFIGHPYFQNGSFH